MSLLAIKKHLEKVKVASLNSLCQLFNADADILRCMLNHLVIKGLVRQCLKKPACGSKCFSCPTAVTEIYEWVM